MSTPTTVKLPEELRSRIHPLASAAGKTVHAWLVDAIAAEVTREEARAAFVADALASKQEVDAGGALWDAGPVFAALREQAAGRKYRRPAPKKARR